MALLLHVFKLVMRMAAAIGWKRFLSLVLMGGVLFTGGTTAARSETRSAKLCDGHKAEVTAVSSKLGKRALVNAINFAITGARDSCRVLSERDSRSQVRFINEQAGNAAVAVGLDLQYLLPRVIKLSRFTNGAFDPTAWSRKKRTSYQDISFDPRARQAMITRRGGSLSFRGIVRGYMADRIAARLRKHGVHSYFINVDGMTKKSSGNDGQSSWMIGIQDPHNRSEDSVCRIALVNRALATVAAYPWEIKEETYPGSAAYASVSVLTADAMTADALANAAMVVGDKAIPMIQRIGGSGAVFISHQGQLRVIGSVPAACLY